MHHQGSPVASIVDEKSLLIATPMPIICLFSLVISIIFFLFLIFYVYTLMASLRFVSI